MAEPKELDASKNDVIERSWGDFDTLKHDLCILKSRKSEVKPCLHLNLQWILLLRSIPQNPRSCYDHSKGMLQFRVSELLLVIVITFDFVGSTFDLTGLVLTPVPIHGLKYYTMHGRLDLFLLLLLDSIEGFNISLLCF